jgi:hypothetical protein
MVGAVGISPAALRIIRGQFAGNHVLSQVFPTRRLPFLLSLCPIFPALRISDYRGLPLVLGKRSVLAVCKE